MLELTYLALASLSAGFVDAIVGGGGLILIPVLVTMFPHAAPAVLLGTNKAAAVCGTTSAAVHYARHVELPWRAFVPAVLAAVLGSAVGAFLLTRLPSHAFKKFLPLVLLAVFVYTLVNKKLGQTHARHYQGAREASIASTIGLSIGFYDGFFGPGTGSFFTFSFVRVLGYDFLHASAAAKLLNVATNVAALTLFSIKGTIWWREAIVMGVANILGSLLGTRLALRHGAGFVRGAFIIVVGALILKTGQELLEIPWRPLLGQR